MRSAAWLFTGGPFGAVRYSRPGPTLDEGDRAVSAEITIFNPDGLGKPLGQYSQITRVKGASEYVFIAGQLATDRSGALVGADDFDGQCTQVFANIGAALGSVGGGWKNVVQF